MYGHCLHVWVDGAQTACGSSHLVDHTVNPAGGEGEGGGQGEDQHRKPVLELLISAGSPFI